MSRIPRGWHLALGRYPVRNRWAFVPLLALAASVTPSATELQTRTVAAFDRYVRANEGRLKTEPFLRVDRLPPARRADALALMRRGELSIDAVVTLEGERE